MISIGDRIKVVDQNITGRVIEDYGNNVVIVDDDSEFESPENRLEFKKSDVKIIEKERE